MGMTPGKTLIYESLIAAAEVISRSKLCRTRGCRLVNPKQHQQVAAGSQISLRPWDGIV
jgi:hypothetical protein